MKRWILPALLLGLAWLLPACGDDQKEESRPQPTAEASPAAATDTSQVFHLLAFEGVRHYRYLMLFQGPDKPATLYTLDEIHTLQPVPAASGARYQGKRHLVWVRGDEVLFEVDGQRVGPCRVSGLQSILARAWLAGTRFWASGNEPSWNLIIGNERVVLLTDLGETRHEFPGLSQAELDPREPFGRYQRQADGHTLEIQIRAEHCHDTMSGAPFPAAVSVKLDGQEMRGCGTGLF